MTSKAMKMSAVQIFRRNSASTVAALCGLVALLSPSGAWAQAEPSPDLQPDELFGDLRIIVPDAQRVTSPGLHVVWGTHTSVQVNVDSKGRNIVGDAANEPSIAIDPTQLTRMAIGWRQFDSVASSFRQAGVAYSTDGGASWTSPGVLEPGVFRSDPVLDYDIGGNFYYSSLTSDLTTDIFRSSDGGATWDGGVDAFGGDKQWMSIDRTGGASQGVIYQAWYGGGGCCFPDMFNRSTDGGVSYEAPIEIADMRRGTTSVGADGAVYVTGHLSSSFAEFVVARSTSLANPDLPAAFDRVVPVELGGLFVRGEGPNPSGMLGQVWVVADPMDSDRVYVLCSVDPPGDDPLDVHFVRSLDGGATWSAPVRINDDSGAAWQWFGTLAVAPSGRLDVIWNDTRDDPAAGGLDSVLYYSFSEDGGVSWSANQAMTPAWDPLLGFPQQNKIGDYYDMISFDEDVHLTYAATFNGEQDVYYLRFEPLEDQNVIFRDGFESGGTGAWSAP